VDGCDGLLSGIWLDYLVLRYAIGWLFLSGEHELLLAGCHTWVVHTHSPSDT
jgi:hypothetical protein